METYSLAEPVVCVLSEWSERVIADVWSVLKHHEDKKAPMPPTTCFKANSLVMFTVMCELFALIIPRHIKLSLTKVFSTYRFNEYYCPCGVVTVQEQAFLYHIKAMHLPALKLYQFMRNSHINADQIRLDDLCSSETTLSLASVQDRLVRLFWLVREVPRVPMPGPGVPFYSFQEIFEFEAGLRSLDVDI